MAAITLGPQLMGHTVFNWALRYMEASIISGTILAEPVVAAFLAWLVLSERPGLLTLPAARSYSAGCIVSSKDVRSEPDP